MSAELVGRGLRALWAPWIVLVGLAVPSAHAQTASSIVGTVRDGSGGALVGVTVEVSSPALIERSKVAVTGADGTYRVVDLRPGDYEVTLRAGRLPARAQAERVPERRLHGDGGRRPRGRTHRRGSHGHGRSAADRHPLGHFGAAASAGAARGHPGRAHPERRGAGDSGRDVVAAGRRRLGDGPDQQHLDPRIAGARSRVEHRRPQHDGEHRRRRRLRPVSEPGRLPGSRRADPRAAGRDRRRRRQRQPRLEGRRQHATAATLFTTYTRQIAPEPQRQRRTGGARPRGAERDRHVLRPERRHRRPDRDRQAVVLRQRPAVPHQSARGQHLQPRQDAGARRERDLERHRQADLADQPEATGCRRSSTTATRCASIAGRRRSSTSSSRPRRAATRRSAARWPTSSWPRRCARTCCSNPASRWYYVPWSLDYQPDLDPAAFPRNDLDGLDADRRLRAVDDAGLAGAAHLERRRVLPAVVARRAPDQGRRCSSSTRPTSRTTTRSATATSSPATATASPTRCSSTTRRSGPASTSSSWRSSSRIRGRSRSA